MDLKSLRAGIPLDNFGVRIPWLITETELFQFVPETEFTRSAARWPLLRCTVLGIELEWGFNFVTHAHDRFIGLRYDSWETQQSEQTFAAASTQLQAVLESANQVVSRKDRLRWQDDWVCITNEIWTRVLPDGRECRRHTTFVYALSSDPATLALQRGRTVQPTCCDGQR
jgi:hypothetical protein